MSILLEIVLRALPLAQLGSDDGAGDAAHAPPNRPMSFSDLQQGFRAYNEGQTTDNTMRNGILILMAVVAVVALLIHFRQRQKTGEPPDSLAKLGLSLGRSVRFPVGSRLMLWWVARSSKMPFASLLLSSTLFDKCVAAWAALQTLTTMRRWGQGRLERLRPVLFS